MRTLKDESPETIIRFAIERLRAQGKTDEQIIDLCAKAMAETLPERNA